MKISFENYRNAGLGLLAQVGRARSVESILSVCRINRLRRAVRQLPRWIETLAGNLSSDATQQPKQFALSLRLLIDCA
jgi:hypothetical protein